MSDLLERLEVTGMVMKDENIKFLRVGKRGPGHTAHFTKMDDQKKQGIHFREKQPPKESLVQWINTDLIGNISNIVEPGISDPSGQSPLNLFQKPTLPLSRKN